MIPQRPRSPLSARGVQAAAAVWILLGAAACGAEEPQDVAECVDPLAPSCGLNGINLRNCVTAWNEGTPSGKAGASSIGFISKRAAIRTGNRCIVVFDLGEQIRSYGAGAGFPGDDPAIGSWAINSPPEPRARLPRYNFRGWNATQHPDGTITLNEPPPE